MAIQQSFRSALNGFNRDDVVRYIEYLNTKHVAEINQLTSELEYLRGKQNTAPEVPAEDAVDPVIEQQAGRIRELFDEKKALTEELEALREEKAALEQQLSDAQAGKLEITALQQQDSTPSRVEEELEAYRRAERTERLARDRAEQMYRQANGVIADATAKVDEAAGQIGELTDRVMNQLAELQNAVTNSKQALRDAAATMYTIRPESQVE